MTLDVYVNRVATCSALGASAADTAERLAQINSQTDSPLQATDSYSPGRSVPLGRLNFELPAMPQGSEQFECRNNRVLWHLYREVAETLSELAAHSDWSRVGLILGTSTSGIEESEFATAERLNTGELPESYHFVQQQLSGGSDFLTSVTSITGPSFSISTACSSSGHALATAKRLIEMDLCDVVLAGGVDTLCQFTVQGFAALEAVSPDLTNPFSANRRGINLGEGGALFVLSRYPADVALKGVGASTDAHHISAPHPEGKGAASAMQAALTDAGIEASEVDYVNLHGTGTGQNDSAEGMAVNALFGESVLASTTKPLTGHTLGAAGILEAALCYLMLSKTFNPSRRVLPHIYDGSYDPEIKPVKLATPDGTDLVLPDLSVCLSNSFAFGGNNAAIVLGLVE